MIAESNVLCYICKPKRQTFRLKTFFFCGYSDMKLSKNLNRA